MLTRIVRGFRRSIPVKRIENFVVPQPGEGIAEITISKWHIKPNQVVSEFERVCEVYSDKSSLELKSPYDGVIKEMLYKDEDIVKVGEILYRIDISDEKYPEKNAKGASPQISEVLAEEPSEKLFTKVAPSTRNLIKKHGLDLSKIKASGKHGMVLKEDILSYLENPMHSIPPIMPEVFFSTEDKSCKLSPLQVSMKSNTKSALSIPRLTLFEDVCMDSLIGLRMQLKSSVKDTKITYMPFFIKALSLAILDYPIVNSVLLGSKTEYLQKASHNISFAMDSPYGLQVPNIKNVGSRSIYDIAIELNRLQSLGLKNELAEEDLNDSTIGISNIGSIGGKYVTHIVFPPHTFLGAFGTIRQKLEKNGSEIVEKNVLATSWSADHRIIDGATTARFVMRWKAIIENPALMLLHLK